MRQRRDFTREFKLEAVRLVAEEGRPLAEVARELALRPDQLRRWRRQLEGRRVPGPHDAFPARVTSPRLRRKSSGSVGRSRRSSRSGTS